MFAEVILRSYLLQVRNTSHVYVEHKRRTDIKKGFDMLRSLIPELKKNPNAKVNTLFHNYIYGW
jgi:hypothetical protein